MPRVDFSDVRAREVKTLAWDERLFWPVRTAVCTNVRYGGLSMPGSQLSYVSLSFAAALACVLTPALAIASPASPTPARTDRDARAKPCAKAPVEVVAGADRATFPLAACDGGALRSGVDEFSILARPATAAKPTEPLPALAKSNGTELAPGVRRVDSRLVERLQLVVDHFATENQPARVVLLSGYRPRGSGSYHSTGRAIDFRIEGVKNDTLAAFCKTLPDTGCGLYPNDVFVHMDVRNSGTGHVAWVDTSRQAAIVPGRSVTAGAPLTPPKDPPSASASAPGLSIAKPIEQSDLGHADAAKEKLPPLPAKERRISRRKRHKKSHPESRSI